MKKSDYESMIEIVEYVENDPRTPSIGSIQVVRIIKRALESDFKEADESEWDLESERRAS